MLRLARSLLTLALLIASLLALSGGPAGAAEPPEGTIGPSPAPQTTTWIGQFPLVPAPSGCLPQALDAENGTCDHYQLTVTAAGDVTVDISWSDATNDWDLYVYGPTGMLIRQSVHNGTTSESVTFPASAGTYEVRVAPVMVVTPTACPNAPAEIFAGYCGTATYSQPPPPPPPPGGGVDPPLSIGNATVTEGDSGTTAATFVVTLGWPTISPVTVNYATVDLNANATALPGSDYVPQTGTLVFPPGATRATLTVPVIGDTNLEPNETFFVDLYLPSPPIAVAKLADSQGLGTIRNDDSAHAVRGGGTLLQATGSRGSFVVRGDEFHQGKVGFYDGTVRFYATQITQVVFVDATRSATIEGSGFNAGHAVTYALEVADNGPGTLDRFVLTLSDGSRVAGTVTSGDIAYQAG